ncbi:MAG: hypothetical protein IKK66_04665 [Ruminococcus sp.]|nr:hypothetical protein [Ruminococcus sp.]
MKKTKRFLTALTASVLSVSALSSFTASAENETPVSNNDYIAEQLIKELDEYMAEKGYVKANEKFYPLYFERPYFSRLYNPNSYQLAYFEDYENRPDCPGVWGVNVDSAYIDLYCEFSEGISTDDINNYIKEKHPEFEDNKFNGKIFHIRDYRIPANDKIDIKGLIDELKENNMIETAELRYGDIQERSGYAGHHMEPMSWFRPTEVFSSIADEFITTKQDILDYYAAGNIDCEFGIIVITEKLPEGVEYIPFGDMYNIDYYNKTADYHGYIPITPEEAAELDKEIFDAIEFFSAVPHENTLENQIDLLYEINNDVYIYSNDIGYADGGGRNLPLMTIEVDVTNAINGDANCDKKFTIADSTAILQSIGNPDKYGLSLEGEYNADCSGTFDGVTAADAVFIQRKLAKGIE